MPTGGNDFVAALIYEPITLSAERQKGKKMFFINQYIMSKQDDGTQKLTKAAYDRESLYEAQAEFHKRQGDAMKAASTIWTLCMILDENGAVYASEKAVKPVEQTEPSTEE